MKPIRMNKLTWSLLFAFSVIFISGCNSNSSTKQGNSDSLALVEAIGEYHETVVNTDKKSFKQDVSAYLKKLEPEFGKIPFYFGTDSGLFFIVVKGQFKYADYYDSKWERGNFTMGVVNSNGKIIVPIEFSKIFNPNQLFANTLVVEKNGKFGLYSLSGKQLVAAEYDMLYPSGKSDALVHFSKNNEFGWIGSDGTVHTSDNPEPYIHLTTSPLQSNLLSYWKFASEKANWIYFAQPDIVGDLIFTPPYAIQLFNTSEVYMISSDMPGMQTLEMKMAESKSWGEKLKALVINWLETGMDPRENYASNGKDLVVIDENLNAVQKIRLETHYENNRGCDNSRYRFLENNMLEIVKDDYTVEYPFHTLPLYEYYQVTGENSVKKLESNRKFAYTKYVKIDESYFKGCFIRMANDNETPKGEEAQYMSYEIKTMHLSIEDLDYMRNEIFAEYGYKFKNEKWQKIFAASKWYSPQSDNVDAKLTETDKYNIDIILKMKAKLEKDEKSFTKPELISSPMAG